MRTKRKAFEMTNAPPRMDEGHLRRCVALAAQALESGDDPFGSVLVDADGAMLAEAMNRERSDGDPTAHPELALVRWAIAHLTPDQRAASTVYTSGEHCPMCAAAHGWAGLGPVVAAASSAQLAQWRASWGLPAGRVTPLPVTDIAPEIIVIAPVAPFDAEMRELHRRASRRELGANGDVPENAVGAAGAEDSGSRMRSRIHELE